MTDEMHAKTPREEPNINQKAVLALILGIGAPLIGIFYSHFVLREIKRGHLSGRVFAVWGLALGYLWVFLLAVLIVFVSLLARNTV